ncbi:MAG: hypothetical protein ABSG02_20810, partial [Terriglobales bacterium]
VLFGGRLRRSAPAVSLASGSKLAEVVTAALGDDGAALTPQRDSGSLFGLLEKIVSERQSRAEQFTASGSSVLWEFWRSGENLIGLRDQIFERCEFFPL